MKHVKLFEDFQSEFYVGDKQNVKDGLVSLFKEYPELESIGTKQEYSQYLNRIFPNSRIKDSK